MKIYCLQIKEDGKTYIFAFTHRTDRQIKKLRAAQRGAKWQEWTLNTANKDEEGALIHEEVKRSGTFTFTEDKPLSE